MDDLIEVYANCLKSGGLDGEAAHKVARAQVEVEAFGVTTHGFNPLNVMVKSLAEGKADPAARPTVERETGVTRVLRGNGCLPVLAMLEARDRALALARQHGIGWVSATGLGWVGALGYHLAAAAREGFLAMAFAQLSGGQSVVPFGGREPRLSTNPLALVVPAQPDPIVADFATSAVSNGKVGQWKSAGKMCPEPMLIDRQGRPTDDAALFPKEAALLPFGGANTGFRGTAMALFIEALTAATGARPANVDKKGGQSYHLLVINGQALGDRQVYQQHMGELLGYLRSSPPAEGSTGVRMPGEMEWTKLRDAQANGVPIGDYHVNELKKITADCGVNLPPALGKASD